MLLIWLYENVLNIFSPFLRQIMKNQGARRGVPEERICELWGDTNLPPPYVVDIWGHAVSVGEVKSLLTLFKRIAYEYPDYRFLITTTTSTAAQVVKQEKIANVIHQYLPFDVPIWVDAFLERWSPKVGFIVEQELWPCLIHRASARGIQLSLVNGRLTDKSKKRWLKIPKTAKTLLQCFDQVFAQSLKDKDNFSAILEGTPIHYVGNLKLSAQSKSVNTKTCNEFQKMIGSRLFWVAASLHPDEETAVLHAHVRVKKDFDNLLTVMIPRHMKNMKLFEQACKERGLNYSVRSRHEKIKPETEVYIADTMGELSNFYYMSEVSFVGGSLVPGIGGHNPIEAACMNTAIIMGPYTFNFSQIHKDLMEREAVITVHNSEELASKIIKLLMNPYKRKNFQDLANLYVEENNPLEEIYKIVQPMLLKKTEEANIQ